MKPASAPEKPDLDRVIRERLTALEPAFVELRDDSARHAGHPGAAAGGGHFVLTVVAARFAGLNAVARHRMVYSLFQDLMPHHIHALSLKAISPAEWDPDGSTKPIHQVVQRTK